MINVAEQATKPKQPAHLSGWFNDVSRNMEAAPIQEYAEPQPLKKKLDQIVLEEQSGYFQDRIDVKGNPQEEEEEKNRKKKERDLATSQMFASITTNDVLNNLNDSISFDHSLMGMYMRDVQPEDMLKENGKVVATIDQKRAIEEKGRNCSALLTQEEVVFDKNSGKIITTQDYTINMLIQERIDYKTKIFAKLDKGEMQPQDLPEDMQKDLKDRTYANAVPTFYDRLSIGQSAMRIEAPKADNAIETMPKQVLRPDPQFSGATPSLSMQ